MHDKTVKELRESLSKYRAKCMKMNELQGKSKYLNAKKNVDEEISRRHVELLREAAIILRNQGSSNEIDSWLDEYESVVE